MVDGAPDLIQRAVARMGRAFPKASVHVERGAAEELPVRAAPSGGPSASHLGSTVNQRTVVVSPTSLAESGIVLPGSGPSRTVEEFRSLKRHLFANSSQVERDSDRASHRIILVTSAKPGDGKTFVSINLALSLAYEKDTRVLLIDADAYRKSVMTVLGISAEQGWLDLVSDGSVNAREAILRTNIPNLAVLPAGAKRAEIPEIMSSRNMENLLNTLLNEDHRRYIIIDSLPCLTSSEPAILAGLASQTLFVVAANQTAQLEVQSSLRLLHASPKVTLILNKAEPMLTEQFGDYGYAYGYSL